MRTNSLPAVPRHGLCARCGGWRRAANALRQMAFPQTGRRAHSTPSPDPPGLGTAPGTLTYPRTTQSVLVCSLLLPGFTFFSRLQPLCYFSAPLPAPCTPAGLPRRAAVSQTAPPAPGTAPCPALYVQFLLSLNRVQDFSPDPKHSMG